MSTVTVCVCTAVLLCLGWSIGRISRESTEWKTDGLNSVVYSVDTQHVDTREAHWLKVSHTRKAALSIDLVNKTRCPFTPPSTKEQHNGGWLYTKRLIRAQHVAFDKGFGHALVNFWDNATVYDIGAGVGQFTAFSQGSSVRTRAFDGGNNIETLAGMHTPLRNDPNYIVPKVCWIDASVPLIMTPKEWVLSIEVGEHIAKARESIFLDNLARLATRGVVLTWAIKGQGGHQHINEQNNEHIIQEMAKRGFRFDRAQSLRFRKSVTQLEWLRNTIMVFLG